MNNLRSMHCCCRLQYLLLMSVSAVGHKTVPFISYWHISLSPTLDHRKLLEDDSDDEGDGSTVDEQAELELDRSCGLFGSVEAVSRAGWGRGGWPHHGAWGPKKHRKAGFA